MDANSPVYNELNKAWKSTCRILLGEEIGELKEYEEWLKEYLPKIGKKKSHRSDRTVTVHPDYYCESSNFISLEEMEPTTIDPLTINQIKDIDSIVEAISERWEYVGDKALGNSTFVTESDNVIDSHYVANSTNVHKSSHVYSSFYVNEAKHVFGGNWATKCEFYIKGGAYNIKRAFETYWADFGSDLYYCYGCFGCQDMLFCFNQRNKRNCIGNIELPKERYSELKSKLIAEIREELKRTKGFPSPLYRIPDKGTIDIDIKPAVRDIKDDMDKINKAFASTTKIVLKKELSPITEYEDWLSRYLIKPTEITSLFGGRTYRLDIINEIEIYPEDRIVSQQEAEELGKLQLDQIDIGSLRSVIENLPKIAYFFGDIVLGKTENSIKSPVASYSFNVYKVGDPDQCEYCALSGVINSSKYVFGSTRVVDSQFVINCYNSQNLSRCYGLDACKNSADSLFCHNCEGLQDAMFCFNTKAKRYAIGNSQLSPEQYRKIKDMLVCQMADELESRKTFKYDIFNIGCGRI